MAGRNTLSRISLGLVLVLVWGWMYLRADQLFPVNTDAFKDIIQFYIIFTAFIFSWDTAISRKAERPLFEVSFLRAFPKFILFAGISLLILFLFGLFYRGDALPSVYQAISGVGLGVVLLHAFFVSILEEKVFRNWLVRQLEHGGITKARIYILQAVIFAFFHYSLNRELLSIAIYIPLGLLFMYVRDKYSPKTDMANSGVHFAWNLFILGFLV
jgi:membrane protease YdiL (CAAX protease family)